MPSQRPRCPICKQPAFALDHACGHCGKIFTGVKAYLDKGELTSSRPANWTVFQPKDYAPGEPIELGWRYEATGEPDFAVVLEWSGGANIDPEAAELQWTIWEPSQPGGGSGGEWVPVHDAWPKPGERFCRLTPGKTARLSIVLHKARAVRLDVEGIAVKTHWSSDMLGGYALGFALQPYPILSIQGGPLKYSQSRNGQEHIAYLRLDGPDQVAFDGNPALLYSPIQGLELKTPPDRTLRNDSHIPLIFTLPKGNAKQEKDSNELTLKLPVAGYGLEPLTASCEVLLRPGVDLRIQQRHGWVEDDQADRIRFMHYGDIENNYDYSVIRIYRAPVPGDGEKRAIRLYRNLECVPLDGGADLMPLDFAHSLHGYGFITDDANWVEGRIPRINDFKLAAFRAEQPAIKQFPDDDKGPFIELDEGMAYFRVIFPRRTAGEFSGDPTNANGRVRVRYSEDPEEQSPGSMDNGSRQYAVDETLRYTVDRIAIIPGGAGESSPALALDFGTSATSMAYSDDFDGPSAICHPFLELDEETYKLEEKDSIMNSVAAIRRFERQGENGDIIAPAQLFMGTEAEKKAAAPKAPISLLMAMKADLGKAEDAAQRKVLGLGPDGVPVEETVKSSRVIQAMLDFFWQRARQHRARRHRARCVDRMVDFSGLRATVPCCLDESHERGYKEWLERILRHGGDARDVVIFDEATAAAFGAFRSDKRLLDGLFSSKSPRAAGTEAVEEEKTILLVDIGGGTTDAAILSLKRKPPEKKIKSEIKNMGGDRNFGGNDITRSVARLLMWEYLRPLVDMWEKQMDSVLSCANDFTEGEIEAAIGEIENSLNNKNGGETEKLNENPRGDRQAAATKAKSQKGNAGSEAAQGGDIRDRLNKLIKAKFTAMGKRESKHEITPQRLMEQLRLLLLFRRDKERMESLRKEKRNSLRLIVKDMFWGSDSASGGVNSNLGLSSHRMASPEWRAFVQEAEEAKKALFGSSMEYGQKTPPPIDWRRAALENPALTEEEKQFWEDALNNKAKLRRDDLEKSLLSRDGQNGGADLDFSTPPGESLSGMDRAIVNIGLLFKRQVLQAPEGGGRTIVEEALPPPDLIILAGRSSNLPIIRRRLRRHLLEAHGENDAWASWAAARNEQLFFPGEGAGGDEQKLWTSLGALELFRMMYADEDVNAPDADRWSVTLGGHAKTVTRLNTGIKMEESATFKLVLPALSELPCWNFIQRKLSNLHMTEPRKCRPASSQTSRISCDSDESVPLGNILETYLTGFCEEPEILVDYHMGKFPASKKVLNKTRPYLGHLIYIRLEAADSRKNRYWLNEAYYDMRRQKKTASDLPRIFGLAWRQAGGAKKGAWSGFAPLRIYVPPTESADIIQKLKNSLPGVTDAVRVDREDLDEYVGPATREQSLPAFLAPPLSGGQIFALGVGFPPITNGMPADFIELHALSTEEAMILAPPDAARSQIRLELERDHQSGDLELYAEREGSRVSITTTSTIPPDFRNIESNVSS